jgi:hypothetical protein
MPRPIRRGVFFLIIIPFAGSATGVWQFSGHFPLRMSSYYYNSMFIRETITIFAPLSWLGGYLHLKCMADLEYRLPGLQFSGEPGDGGGHPDFR